MSNLFTDPIVSLPFSPWVEWPLLILMMYFGLRLMDRLFSREKK